MEKFTSSKMLQEKKYGCIFFKFSTHQLSANIVNKKRLKLFKKNLTFRMKLMDSF